MINQKIYVAADTLVFGKKNNNTYLLLIKRKNDPYKGLWALPGGFVEDDEDLHIAAMRELEEETGMKLSSVTQFHTYGKPGRDPRFRTVSIVHYAIVNMDEHTVQGGDDAADAQWINLNDISELAFDHKTVVDMAVSALADKLR